MSYPTWWSWTPKSYGASLNGGDDLSRNNLGKVPNFDCLEKLGVLGCTLERKTKCAVPSSSPFRMAKTLRGSHIQDPLKPFPYEARICQRSKKWNSWTIPKPVHPFAIAMVLASMKSTRSKGKWIPYPHSSTRHKFSLLLMPPQWKRIVGNQSRAQNIS